MQVSELGLILAGFLLKELYSDWRGTRSKMLQELKALRISIEVALVRIEELEKLHVKVDKLQVENLELRKSLKSF